MLKAMYAIFDARIRRDDDGGGYCKRRRDEREGTSLIYTAGEVCEPGDKFRPVKSFSNVRLYKTSVFVFARNDAPRRSLFDIVRTRKSRLSHERSRLNFNELTKPPRDNFETFYHF